MWVRENPHQGEAPALSCHVKKMSRCGSAPRFLSVPLPLGSSQPRPERYSPFSFPGGLGLRQVQQGVRSRRSSEKCPTVTLLQVQTHEAMC